MLGPLGLWVRAQRWRYLFPAGSNPPGLVPAVMIGYMVNNVLPLRVGEAARVYVVARRWGRGFWTVLASLVVERVLDGLTIVLMLGVLVLLIDVPGYLRWGAAVMLAVNVVGVTVLVTLGAAPAAARRILLRLTRRWPGTEAVAARSLARFVRGLDGIRTPAHALPLALWTLAVWGVPVLFVWSALRATNLSLPWLAPFTVLAFIGVGVSIPSAPGYVGVFHAAATLAVGLFGVPSAEGLGYALLLHASQFVPITLIGWVFLLREHVSLTTATHAAAPADEVTLAEVGEPLVSAGRPPPR